MLQRSQKRDVPVFPRDSQLSRVVPVRRIPLFASIASPVTGTATANFHPPVMANIINLVAPVHVRELPGVLKNARCYIYLMAIAVIS